jgi:predicted phosphodiesterase
MSERGCRINVLSYIRARDTLATSTANDPKLFLFLGDLHLPPVYWFYRDNEVSATSTIIEPPDWLQNLPAMRRQTNYQMNQYYSRAQLDRKHNRDLKAHGPVYGNPDIFQSAGADLMIFLNAIIDLSPATKQLLHFIQTGDMFEMWQDRPYQYQPGYFDPHWLDSESPNRVSNWALEVMIQNTPVIDAFQNLERAGLAEVKYVWGNHDAYLKETEVISQLNLPPRQPAFNALNGDLFCEHGHRFDRKNFDNTDYGFTSGPSVSNKVYKYPILREAEDFGREFTSIGHPSKQLDCHLLGATLIYLYQRYDLLENPFSIYIMGHSHKHNLLRFNIRAEFHLYEGSG